MFIHPLGKGKRQAAKRIPPAPERNRLAVPRFLKRAARGADARAAMKTVLSLAALAEAATGAALLAFPSIVLRLLFGDELPAPGM